MNRILLVLRHGKSSHGWSYRTDFERPLAPRGEKAAPQMGRLMRSMDVPPDLIVTSPAERAIGTARLVQSALGDPQPPLETDRRIYAAGVAELLEVVREQPDAHEILLMVGHNPGFEELVDLLAGGGTVMKTCSLAVIALGELPWSRVGPGVGRLVALRHPRSAKG